MNNRLPWNDLKLVLAIATAGSLSGAGRALKLSHATVFRHLNGIEARLGVKLFERGRTGYAPTLAGEEISEAARRIEQEVAAVERRVAGRDLRPSGRIRVTTTDSLMVGLLAPFLTGFRIAYPDIELEISLSNQLFNLSKREADLAIRPSASPPEHLIGRRIGSIRQAVYGHRDLVAQLGQDPDLRAADWIGPDEAMGYRELDAWLATEGLEARCGYRVDSLLGIHAAVAAAAGLTVLPCYLGEGDARLRRVGEPIEGLSSDLWLLTHADLRRTGRVRAFLDFLRDATPLIRERVHGLPRHRHSVKPR